MYPVSLFTVLYSVLASSGLDHDPHIMSLVFTLHGITVSNHTHIGEPPAATADLAIDNDCISEISDFLKKKFRKCFISEFKDGLINYCISETCVIIYVFTPIK